MWSYGRCWHGGDDCIETRACMNRWDFDDVADYEMCVAMALCRGWNQAQACILWDALIPGSEESCAHGGDMLLVRHWLGAVPD